MTGKRPSRIWECPECGRSVNRFVNGYRCPSCRTDASEECDRADGQFGAIAR